MNSDRWSREKVGVPGLVAGTIATIICFSLMWLMSVWPVYADNPFPDVDGDGLSNEMETSGWYSLAGGPFFTDPLDADSDDDGLSDGEEKLFDTHPLDETSPGIYVKYVDAYQTKEYFRTQDPSYLPMKQAGNQYLMTETMVVRRGTALYIGGPVGAALSITGSGLASLNPTKDIYGGGWVVNLPNNGTVGTYVATVSLGGWQKQMTLYVIFEIPSELTQPQIATFLYNDNAADLRDEVGVIWRTRGYTYFYKQTYSNISGWAQSFWTDQFKKYVFVDMVMPTIHGSSSQNQATTALLNKADREVRVNYSSYLTTDMYTTVYKEWDGVGWKQAGTPCHSQGGALTSLLRSAGIPANPFIISWNSTGFDYDTSVMAWFNGRWMAARSYRRQELDKVYYPFDGGYTSQVVLENWDTWGSYRESSGAVMIAVGENWDFEQWRIKQPGERCPLGESDYGRRECFLGGMVGTRFEPDAHMIDTSQEYEWEGHRPLSFREQYPNVVSLSSVLWKGDSWLPPNWPVSYTLPNPYPGGNYSENWPIEPVPMGCPPGFLGTCPFPSQNHVQNGFAWLGAATVGMPYQLYLPSVWKQTNQAAPAARIDSILGDQGVDWDQDGLFEKMMVQVRVQVLEPGYYTVGGVLTSPDSIMSYAGLYASSGRIYLDRGMRVISLYFDGWAVGEARTERVYQVTHLWITDQAEFDPRLGPWDQVLDSQRPNYETRPYRAGEFETRAASFADLYDGQGIDRDNDGIYEAIAVNVALDIASAAVYRVEGDLYDNAGNWIDHAVWLGSDSTAVLEFQVGSGHFSYHLENLRLFQNSGALLDSRQRDIWTLDNLGGDIRSGAINLELYSHGVEPQGAGITPTLVFTVTPVDLNGNSLYDQLVVNVKVQVGQAGWYRAEGWLQGQAGNLIAYAPGDLIYLPVGTRTLPMVFDGPTLRSHGVVSGTCNLVAIRVLGNNGNYDLRDQVQSVSLSFPYRASNFDPANKSDLILFDDMENGGGQWSFQSPWQLERKMWPQPSWVWSISPANLQNKSLTGPSLDIVDISRLTVRFNTTYRFPSSGFGYVETSSDGIAWTRVLTLTNATNRWATQLIDLGHPGSISTWQLRFRANASSGAQWYVDDVYVNAWPSENLASFTFTPQPALANTDILFIADYTFITPTLPVTLTWNFGDGSPIQATHSSSIVHRFPLALDYTVVMTAANAYTRVVKSQLVDVYDQLNLNVVGGGSIFKSPDQPLYRHSDLVTLTAVANGGWRFGGWSGDLGGSVTPQSLTIDGHKTVTATFNEVLYTLTANTVGSGSVSKSPNLMAYHYNDVVQLTALAAPGWTFDRWSGDLSGSQNPAALTMTEDKTVTAVFVQNEYTLVTTVNGSGSVTRSPNKTTYTFGEVVTLTATPAPGWMFTGWSGDLGGSANPATVVMNGHKMVTASFAQINYVLTVNLAGSGGVTRTPNQVTYHYGDSVILAASPAVGWRFDGWSGDLTGSVNPTTLTMNGHKTVLATFAPLEYILTVNVLGGGSVSRNPVQTTYRHGEQVELTATPNPGWRFVGWSGDMGGSANPATLIMTGNRTVTATFAQIEYMLTVLIDGGGSVTRSPNQATFHYGDIVQLTAQADTGWEFSHWSGDLAGSQNPAAITLYGNRTVTAHFSRLGYALTVSVAGGGSVTRWPDKPVYEYGETVTVTAAPGANWSFVGWSGDLSGTTNPQTLVMNGHRSVTASFSPNGYLITLNLDGRGSITKTPDRDVYQPGEVVTLTITADPGWTFTGWSGDLSGMDPTKTLTMDGHKDVTAHLMSDEYTLSVNNVGSGYVIKNPAQSTYLYGDVVTLTAYATAGYVFSGWSGDLGGTANPITITINGNKNVVATYTFVGWTLTTQTNGSGNVTRSPDLAQYSHNAVVMLTAAAAPGWTFSHWSGSLTGSVNPAQLTMNGNKTVTAHFVSGEYTLSVNVNGSGSVSQTPNQATYHYGDVVTLTAISVPGWTFAGWSGGLSGTVNPASLTITGPVSVTALFSQDAYTLSIALDGSGSVSRAPDKTAYTYGEAVTLTAVPAPGWAFTGWSGDLNGSANSQMLTMDSSKSVVAHMAQLEYGLTINVAGSGSVARSPEQATYHYGDVITLTAIPAPGWVFVGWSGDLSGATNPAQITVSDHHVVLATFVRAEYTLNIHIAGEGGVTRVPEQAAYHYGDVVTLTAISAPGWTFVGWSDHPGSTNPYSLTMTGSTVLTATFVQIEYELLVNIIGSGSVGKNPDRPTYHYGDVVTLTAVPSAGWNFAGWPNPGGYANPITVTVQDHTAVSARFVLNRYTLTINVMGSGNVIRYPDQFTYYHGDVVTLTAAPAWGWHLTGWSACAGCSDNPIYVVMEQDEVITATFEPDEQVLSVAIIGDGDVMRDPDRSIYQYGDPITLTAIPAAGWTFAGWSGDLSGAASPVQLTMNANKAVTATFVMVAKPVSGVTFDWLPPTPTAGQPITFTATVTPPAASPPIAYTWSWGDGSPPLVTTSPAAAHTFAAPGTYTVQVTAGNGHGAPAAYNRQIDIAAAAPDEYFIYLPLALRMY